MWPLYVRPSYVLLVSVTVVSVFMATCGVGQDSFSFKEAASYYWDFLLNSRAILRTIASDSSTSDIFLPVFHITILIYSSQ